MRRIHLVLAVVIVGVVWYVLNKQPREGFYQKEVGADPKGTHMGPYDGIDYAGWLPEQI